MDGAEVGGKGAVMDTEGLGGGVGYGWVRYQCVENGPLVLQGAAVGWAFGEKRGDFVGAASNAEAADSSLLNEVFQELEEAVVL